MRLRVHLFFFFVIVVTYKKRNEKPGIYFLLFFFFKFCVCVWHPFPSRWLRSVLSRFTPTVDQSETSKGEGTEWRRATQVPAFAASGRRRRSPLRHRSSSSLATAVTRTKNVSTPTWYSHIPPLLHIDSLGRLCALNVGGRAGSRPKVWRSRASSHLNTTLRPIFFLHLSHTSICLLPPERSFIPVPSSVPPGHIFTKSNC